MITSTQLDGLRVSGLTVTYGLTRAVSGAELTVPRGQTVTIMGPSGCGKSSLLAAIAGLVPSEGSLTWNGAELSALAPHARGVGLVFQDGLLFPHRDVAANVAFGLEMKRVPARERQRRVMSLLDMVGLADLAHRRIGELSGGERQRVALARALAPSPKVLLLDEPLSSLDASLRERMGRDIRELLRSTATTAILVTHDAAEAKLIGDVHYTMDAGIVRPQSSAD